MRNWKYYAGAAILSGCALAEGCVGAAATYDYFHGGIPVENQNIYKALAATPVGFLAAASLTYGLGVFGLKVIFPKNE